MANDLLQALRTYIAKLSAGEKSPQEVAAALNAWAKESSEAIRVRVEEEISRSAAKMGFAKQEELDHLREEIEALKRLAGVVIATPKKAAEESVATAKASAKKARAKKAAVKKAGAKKAGAKKAGAIKNQAGKKKIISEKKTPRRKI
jgi:vacuolar-type H+-ATPase subunit I/STV1